MKKLLVMLAISAVIGASYAQTTDPTSTTNNNNTTSVSQTTTTYQISPLMSQHNMGWEDAAATIALARATGLTPDVIISNRGTTTTPYFELAPAYVLSQQSGRPFSDIMSMYNGGQTWLQIAQSLKVPTSYWNPTNADTASWTNTDFTNNVWRNILTTQYAMTPEDYSYFQGQNYPWNEVVVADVYSRELNRPVRDVYTMYSSNNNAWPMAQNMNSMSSGGQQSSSSSSSTTQVTEQQRTTTTPSPVTTTTSRQDTFSVPPNHHTQTVFGSGQNQSSYSSTQDQGVTTTTRTRSRHALRRHHRRHRSRRPCR